GPWARLLPLLAQPLALLGRHLPPALAEPLALLGAHLAPALLVAEHPLPLLRGHRFPLTEPLLDAVSPVLWQLLPALVRLLQLLLTLLGQLVPMLKVLENLRALVGRELAEAPVVLARRLPLLRGHRLPMTIVLEGALPFLGREPLPALEVALGDRPLLRRELVEPLDRRRRRLPPGNVQAAKGQHGAQQEQHRQAAAGHRSFASLGAGVWRGAVSELGIDSRILMRSRI